MDNSLSISVSVDKSVLSVGDRVQIVGVLRNIASHRFLLYARPAVYPTAHVRIRTRDGTVLREYVKIIYDVRRDSVEDFVEMKPGSEVRMAFAATVRRESIPDVARGGDSVVRGLFLDFESSAILLPGKGEYALSFHFEQPRQLSETQEKEFGIRSVWYGSVASEPLSITVR
jgi:hypothetical protein